ncbi:YceI family protein [Peterkaempfera bronchialis]|uniref:Polyisoprenoid-binding protein n=1 Tax=Peterkaempfera bronchialis TaxID=2126346 RepID=A0A345ST79_9ACTN|nr:YceI family protein [Peterkaempfera bronchialis]AXI76934.1 polyisoprenoid-binding protein [Peterkaempfera bronchialis]
MGLFNRTKTDDDATTPAAAPAGQDLSALTGDYTIDATHSSIGFTVRHAMVTTVRGEFGEYEGKLHLDGADPARSTAELAIKVASIDTKQQQRDEHLRTGDFFEAETHPEITFRSTAAERVDDETYRMTGDLTIKGTTRPVTLDLAFNGSATDPFGNLRVGFEGGTQINRSDWGLTYNAALEGGGVLISDKAKLVLDISAIKNA